MKLAAQHASASVLLLVFRKPFDATRYQHLADRIFILGGESCRHATLMQVR